MSTPTQNPLTRYDKISSEVCYWTRMGKLRPRNISRLAALYPKCKKICRYRIASPHVTNPPPELFRCIELLTRGHPADRVGEALRHALHSIAPLFNVIRLDSDIPNVEILIDEVPVASHELCIESCSTLNRILTGLTLTDD